MLYATIIGKLLGPVYKPVACQEAGGGGGVPIVDYMIERGKYPRSPNWLHASTSYIQVANVHYM